MGFYLCFIKRAFSWFKKLIRLRILGAGILKASRNLAMAGAAGMTGLIGAMPELGIGTAAHIHIALAAPSEVLVHASDCCGCTSAFSYLIYAPPCA